MKIASIIFAAWLVVALCGFAHTQSKASTNDSDEPILKVDVKLVNVFATVTTPAGAPVSTLKKEDFQIFEDGVPQKIAIFDRESSLPLSIVLAVDTSLSTSGNLKFELESA